MVDLLECMFIGLLCVYLPPKALLFLFMDYSNKGEVCWNVYRLYNFTKEGLLQPPG